MNISTNYSSDESVVPMGDLIDSATRKKRKAQKDTKAQNKQKKKGKSRRLLVEPELTAMLKLSRFAVAAFRQRVILR